MQRDSAPCRKARKRIARDIKKSVGGTGDAVTLKIRSGCEGGGKGALWQIEKSATLSCNNDQTLFVPTYCLQGSMIGRADKNGPQGNGINEDVSFTLNATDRHAVAYGIGSYHSEGMKSDNPHSGIYIADTSRTLDLNGGNPACNQGGIAICEPQIYDARGNGDGKIAPTMTGDHQNRVTDYTGIVCMANQAIGECKQTDCASALKQRDYKDATDLICEPVAGIDCRNLTESPELYPTMQAKSQGGWSLNYSHAVRIRYRVRRLTPLECERLQGYPDGWTNIPDYIDDKGKKKSASDSARYKALGNSIALPPWKWVLKRISAQFERDATLGSLFDGIGGFPLIWERLNGKGSARWASEIEQFPIAVTKHWFK